MESINSAEFISIDCEFSGYSSMPDDKEIEYDTIEERYQKIRSVINKFIAFQIGICTFHWDDASKKYKYRPFSFYVWPKSKVTDISKDARSIKYTVHAPAELNKYIAVKGSICIHGTSLTVNSVSDDGFEVNIVPHTQERTIIHGYLAGTEVSLEVDLVARYLESLLLGSTESTKDNINLEMLATAGFSDR